MSSRKKIVHGAGQRVEEVIGHLKDIYKPPEYEVQVFDINDPSTSGKLFQVKEMSEKEWLTSLKNVTGLGTAASVKLLVHEQDLEVEVFGGKWLDKAAVGAVSLVVLWPLILTSGIGAWKQNVLLDRLYEDVALFLAEHTHTSLYEKDTKSKASALTHCPACARLLGPNEKFCGNCGTKIM